MNNEKLREWAELVEIKDLPIRDPPSKHQEQVKLILEKVKVAMENPSLEVYNELRSIKFIACIGQTPYVAYCRYLQHCVNLLDNIVHKDEGKQELSELYKKGFKKGYDEATQLEKIDFDRKDGGN